MVEMKGRSWRGVSLQPCTMPSCRAWSSQVPAWGQHPQRWAPEGGRAAGSMSSPRYSVVAGRAGGSMSPLVAIASYRRDGQRPPRQAVATGLFKRGCPIGLAGNGRGQGPKPARGVTATLHAAIVCHHVVTGWHGGSIPRDRPPKAVVLRAACPLHLSSSSLAGWAASSNVGCGT